MTLKIIKQNFLYILAVGLSIFLLFFFITCTWIGFEVKSLCVDVSSKYGGTCLDSLIMSLQDNTNSFKSRNDAIWALGQIGDPKALPVLQSFYTGNIPDREPYNDTISQYELKKAINLTSGGTNLSAFIWRGLLNPSSSP